MTADELYKAAMHKKSVVGFHWHRSDIRMPAAFVCNMQFRLVMTALPRMKIYQPKRKNK